MSKNPEPASRKKILRQKVLCFICFSKEHLASSCKFHYICRKCNGKHHISICIFDPSKSYANFPVKKIPSMQLLIIFPAIKTLFYYKPLWPQQQTYLENCTHKYFHYLTMGVKELIFRHS